jgi:DNA-binding MarR family transcriptional regulator
MTTQEEAGPDRDRALAELADSGRLLSTAIVLFHTNLPKALGLGSTDVKVLELVRRLGNPSPSDLVTATGFAKNSITDVLDRLVSRGFVLRQPDPADGRKVRAVATEQGIARVGAQFVGLMARLSELNADYSVAELELIATYQRRAAEIQQEEARLSPSTSTSST